MPGRREAAGLPLELMPSPAEAALLNPWLCSRRPSKLPPRWSKALSRAPAPGFPPLGSLAGLPQIHQPTLWSGRQADATCQCSLSSFLRPPPEHGPLSPLREGWLLGLEPGVRNGAGRQRLGSQEIRASGPRSRAGWACPWGSLPHSHLAREDWRDWGKGELLQLPPLWCPRSGLKFSHCFGTR